MDIGIIMVASTTLLYNFVLIPIWSDETYSIFQKTILIIYPILDLGYLTGILIYFFKKGRDKFLFKQNIYFVFGFLFIFIADITFAIDTSDSLLVLYNPFWTIGYVFLAFAALFSKDFKTTGTDGLIIKGKHSKYKNYFLFLLPYIFAGVFVAIVSAEYMFKDPLAFGSTITVLLVFIRQIFTLLENDSLIYKYKKTNLRLEEYASVLRDKNKSLHEMKKLRELEAQTDYLTNLFNRRYIYEWMNHYINEFSENETIELSILLIDVDHYKEVNDVFGHDIGDVVLKDIAQIITKNIRISDKASRYGGDEFMVILPKTQREEAQTIAHTILQSVENNVFDNNSAIDITLSIGNYYWSGTKSNYSFRHIIRTVDGALYEAKKTGRNKIITI